MKRLALIFGTRPEAIKLAPIYHALAASDHLRPIVLFTGQHASMAKQAADCLGLKFDYNLSLMEQSQTPNSLLAKLLSKLEDWLEEHKPDGVIVQGDTTSALGGAITSFHQKLPIFYIESGLRTGRLDAPFPEEMNRVFISKIANVHFCSTKTAAENLFKEQTYSNVHVVGSTVVDAALMISNSITEGRAKLSPAVARLQVEDNPTLLVTLHRRENFGQPLADFCRVLLRLRDKFPQLQIVFPVHLNPRIQSLVHNALQNEPRIYLLEPLNYTEMIYLISKAKLIISDSGGIQEEAPSFGSRVLVTREATERGEAIDSGHCILCPLQNPEALFEQATRELSGQSPRLLAANPFGDGKTAQRCVEIISDYYFK